MDGHYVFVENPHVISFRTLGSVKLQLSSHVTWYWVKKYTMMCCSSHVQVADVLCCEWAFKADDNLSSAS